MIRLKKAFVPPQMAINVHLLMSLLRLGKVMLRFLKNYALWIGILKQVQDDFVMVDNGGCLLLFS
jgi:hypothetical protein